MKELYSQYGELLVQREILDGRIATVKQQIANELNKPKPAPEKKKEEK